MKLVQLMIRDHIRSQRILVELAFFAMTVLFILRNLSNSDATQASLVLYSFLIALYTTSVIADSTEQPFALQRILALPSRQMMLLAIIGSTMAITLGGYLLLIVAGMAITPNTMPSLTTIALALPSLILVIATATILMLLMTPLVATTTQRLIVLGIITIPIAWNMVVSTINLSMPQIDGGLVAAISAVWGFMLWPSFAVYNHAITPSYDNLSLLFHGLHVIIITGVFWVGRRWFDRKPLAIA